MKKIIMIKSLHLQELSRMEGICHTLCNWL